MANDEKPMRTRERWAELRFSVVGPLLASPAAPEELREELALLAGKLWRHPITDQPVRFGLSTIERWYYVARCGNDPIGALSRKRRKDSGARRRVSAEVVEAVRRQYQVHPSWSYKLHADNLAVLLEETPGLGPLPAYSTLRRFMLSEGLLRRPRHRGRELSQSERRAIHRHEVREVRSFETEYVNALWHLDFHHGSLRVLTPEGEWVKPLLLAILDDRSRLIGHAQWYLGETAENLVHGLMQAFLKRGLPRALMTDNGSAMLATEVVEGLLRLSVLHQPTLPYSPYQNGKQEVFWAQVEGRLLAMLEKQPDLTLPLLNQATQAWIEMEYHHARHRETGQTPLARWLDGLSVSRPCPPLQDLRSSFTAESSRSQRRSDGTVSIEGVRFEVPARLRHLPRLQIRYAAWDLTHVFVVDQHTGVPLSRLYPLDKTKNAEGIRRPVVAGDLAPPAGDCADSAGIAPLLRKLMSDYAATGMPPAYIPKNEEMK